MFTSLLLLTACSRPLEGATPQLLGVTPGQSYAQVEQVLAQHGHGEQIEHVNDGLQTINFEKCAFRRLILRFSKGKVSSVTAFPARTGTFKIADIGGCALAQHDGNRFRWDVRSETARLRIIVKENQGFATQFTVMDLAAFEGN